MIRLLKNSNFYFVLCADIVLFAISLILAYAVRFSFEIPAEEWQSIFAILPLVLVLKVLVFVLTGCYRGMWRYTSLSDAYLLAKASLGSTLLLVMALTLRNRFEGYPRSVYLADCIFTLCLCGGFRIAIRMLYMHKRAFFYAISGATCALNQKPGDIPARHMRLLIIGAGAAADMLIREIQANERSPYLIVCCVDDDYKKHGRTIHGIPVCGPIACLPDFVEKFNAMEIMIALPSIAGDRMRYIVDVCKMTGLHFKTLPSISSLIDGRVTVNDLREVNYEDLLGRPPVCLNLDGIGQYLSGKTVAVTGAGGSIGSELCRQIVRFKPLKLILIEASEFNLYQIEKTLNIEHRFEALCPVLGRVQDSLLMSRIFAKYRPQVVLHAAAVKHVPMVEINPWEAIFNNVVGSQVIMNVSEACGVERCVMVSTDKAVRPTNVMGASKRAVEILLQARPRKTTRFMAVRFGNVVGSSGSVVPLFQSQIKMGGPITITHPEMTRYFMTIPEAAQLILQAGSMGEGGEIFILEMGTPVKIPDMARDLVRLSGREPDRDIQIVYTGLRPGEKLYEELITQGEGIVPTNHEKIMVLRRSGSDAFCEERDREIQAHVNELEAASNSFDSARIQAILKQIAPEYTPSNIESFL
jgi:FlaA1/EpsC-like NDP-sugar epimerase